MAPGRCGLRLWLACCLLGASVGVVPAALHAETRTAADLTPEAVWEAIDAANDGDTVELPAGATYRSSLVSRQENSPSFSYPIPK